MKCNDFLTETEQRAVSVIQKDRISIKIKYGMGILLIGLGGYFAFMYIVNRVEANYYHALLFCSWGVGAIVVARSYSKLYLIINKCFAHMEEVKASPLDRNMQ